MKLFEIILLQQPKVDVILLDEAGRDHLTSETQSWRRVKKLVEISLLQQPKIDVILFEEAGRVNFTSATQSWRHFVWWNWSRSFYFSNPKLTSFCLKKLVEIILLQQPKVDIILFDETGRDHLTSATPSWRHFIWRSWSRSFYFRNPKLTSFCLKKLAQIILLQQSKVDVILFEEAGRDHFTSATQSWRR